MNLDDLVQELQGGQEKLDTAQHDQFFSYIAYCASLYIAAAGAGPKPGSAPTPTITPFECPSCHYTGTATFS